MFVFPEFEEDYEKLAILQPLQEPTGDATQVQKNYYKKRTDDFSKTPETFQKFLSICQGFEWGEVGDCSQLVLHDGFQGTLHTIGDDLFSGKASEISYSDNIFSPIDEGMKAFYFMHPKTKKICLFDERIEEVKGTDDPIEVYLQKLYNMLMI